MSHYFFKNFGVILNYFLTSQFSYKTNGVIKLVFKI